MSIEQWEESAHCARVLSLLEGRLKETDKARATSVCNRLCQIDPSKGRILGTS